MRFFQLCGVINGLFFAKNNLFYWFLFLTFLTVIIPIIGMSSLRFRTEVETILIIFGALGIKSLLEKFKLFPFKKYKINLTMKNNCPACLKNKTKFKVLVPDFEYGLPFSAEYAECSNCETNFQIPMPSLKKVSSFYPENYHSFESLGILKEIRSWMRLKVLESLFVKMTKFWILAVVMEIFIFCIKIFSNCTFYGYEIAEKNQQIKYNKGRLIIIKGSIKFLIEKIPKMKIITMNHTIEHLVDPEKVIKKLKNKVSKDGIIDGQTPASDSFEKNLFKKYWSGFHSPRHTVIFKRRIKKIEFKVGMEKIIIKSAFNPASYAVSFCAFFFRNKKITRKRTALVNIYIIR